MSMDMCYPSLRYIQFRRGAGGFAEAVVLSEPGAVATGSPHETQPPKGNPVTTVPGSDKTTPSAEAASTPPKHGGEPLLTYHSPFTISIKLLFYEWSACGCGL